jgi:IS5 family transposase
MIFSPRSSPPIPTAGAAVLPSGLERMLRLYFLQQWNGLADEALEDTVYDSQAMRSFLGINLSTDPVPDATTLLKFRRLLEENDLCAAIFEAINKHLGERGLLMREWKIDWQIAKRHQPIRKIEDGPEKDGLLAEEKKRKPRCGRLSNIRSTSSRISSDIARHATGAWRKTTINCKSSSGWAISWSPPAKWRERGPQTAE